MQDCIGRKVTYHYQDDLLTEVEMINGGVGIPMIPMDISQKLRIPIDTVKYMNTAMPFGSLMYLSQQAEAVMSMDLTMQEDV